ncbi:MAG TPA: PDZ domain-containing protein [Methylomirabilota bacterium]|nr:PDZ domain-containing protein [Methylomirabilota bacterium]
MKNSKVWKLPAVAIATLLAAYLPIRGRAQQAPEPPAPPAPPEASEIVPPMPDMIDLDAQLAQIGMGSAWMGVTIEEVSEDKTKELKLPAVRGVLLTEVQDNSPAAKAGLKPGDVITEYDGERVEGTTAFRRMIRETPPGRTVSVTYWRDAKSQSVSVQLESRQDEMQEAIQKAMPHEFVYRFGVGPNMFPDMPMMMGRTPRLGVEAIDLSGQLGEYFGAPDGEGVLVTDVLADTPAAKAGLKAGDVITKLDGDRVHNVGELRAKLVEKHEVKSVTLTLLRKGAEMSLAVEPQQPAPPKPSVSTGRHMSI